MAIDLAPPCVVISEADFDSIELLTPKFVEKVKDGGTKRRGRAT